MKFRHWIIAGSVPLYIGRMASFMRSLLHLKRQRPHIVRPLKSCMKKQSRYWLNSRRVAGEPAGMPACSSFA
ncbi:hypothetical protein LMG28690_00319 [Paraburkholderia caffeinilytica]|nr:hypothetical protein LMG28690_00319 [Paraburkholderia caffeinilytica]